MVDRSITYVVHTDLHLDTSDEVSLEKVEKFCYLDVGCRWRTWFSSNGQSQVCMEKILWILILTRKGFWLKLKGKVYATCVSCPMHGSETWPINAAHEMRMNQTEMNMMRRMCGIQLNERKRSEELRELLGSEPVSLMIRLCRLRWFGHVDHKDDKDWVKHCTTVETEGTRKTGQDTPRRLDGIVSRMTGKV